jgi:hypothetical protein
VWVGPAETRPAGGARGAVRSEGGTAFGKAARRYGIEGFTVQADEIEWELDIWSGIELPGGGGGGGEEGGEP